MTRQKRLGHISGKLNTKMNKTNQKLRKIKARKYAVLNKLLSLKLKNYLTPITEQETTATE